MKREEIYVGIDVANDRVDVAIRPGGDTWSADYDERGVSELVSCLRTAEPIAVLLEATGGLEVPLVSARAAASLPVVVVNPRQVRDFAKTTGKHAKTDALDAQVLAHFAEAVRPPVRPLRSLCQMLWKLPPGGLAHQAATASWALTGNSAKIPSSNFAPSTSKPIRFLPPFSGRQRSLSLSDTLNTRYNEHKVQCAVSPLHPSSGVRPQPHSAEHRLQRIRCPQMHPVLDREVIEAHERLPVPKHRIGGI